MSEPNSDLGLRPNPAATFEPTARIHSPAPVSRPKQPLLFPEADADEEPVHPQPQPKRFQRFLRPAGYAACAIAGAMVVTTAYGLLGARPGSSPNRASPDSAGGRPPLNPMVVVDRRADTLALTIAAFSLRARMFDTHRMPCSGLARGLQQVEDAWLAYNLARKETLASPDAARDARDRGLYADVRAVEVRFERSSCARP